MIQTRKSLRLGTYDYGTPGIYFITFCTKDKICVLGKIVEGRIILSPIGRYTENIINGLVDTLIDIRIIQYVIMPNHIHILIQFCQPQQAQKLGRIVGSIKSQVSQAFSTSLWQRGYYDHIVRNEWDLANCREYIQNNPLKWHLDTEYRHT